MVDADTPPIVSAVVRESVEFKANAQYHGALLLDLNARLEKARAGGSAKAVALHRSRGKLTARERVARLLDHDAHFLEFSALAAMGLYDDEIPSAGLISGLGVISGRLCVIVANDATVKGGTY